MFEDFVDRHCAELPGAIRAHPFGPEMEVWTVGGKMFAAYTRGGQGVSIKAESPAIAQKMVQEGQAFSAPYLKKGGWVLIAWQNTDPIEMRLHIEASYLRVRQSLDPEITAQLAPFRKGG